MSKKVEIPILETPRLILNPADIKYTDSLEMHFNNWNLIKNLNGSIPWPYPKGGVLEHFKTDALPRMETGKGATWILCQKDTPNEAIGRIDLFYQIDEKRESHRGFWLAEPYWKQGLMTEALFVVNDFAFDVVGMEKMRFDNYADNVGSHRLKEKTGAALIRSETQKWRGKDRIMEIWELSAENWKKFREQ